ncbi:MAG TPA: metal-dependent transcriptional regulator [Acidimicrobiales bacterium]|nr:metal-dependent transcriptional regulator [Acidimicrobiales bacterium]
MDAALTKSERETLKAIWRISSGGSGEEGARTGDLAASLNVTPGTMTATVKKLADRGLAVHTPYHGVQLTDAGRRRAISVVRRHRIVERFLADMLGYAWAEADRLAPSFEHQLPQEVEDRLFAALDCPTTCPHGFPIPSAGTDDLPRMPPLYDLSPGDRAVVALPGSTDPDVAMFLDDLGVRPGVEVEVREKHPFGGPVVVSVDGQDRTLGERVARQILVRREGPAQAGGPDRRDGEPARSNGRRIRPAGSRRPAEQ